MGNKLAFEQSVLIKKHHSPYNMHNQYEKFIYDEPLRSTTLGNELFKIIQLFIGVSRAQRFRSTYEYIEYIEYNHSSS